MITPLLQTGDAAPKFSIDNFNKSDTYDLGEFKGRYLFLQFWSPEKSPVSAEFQAKVQEMYAKLKSKHNLMVLSVCMDDKREDAIKVITENKLGGFHAFTDGWKHSAIDEFGVRRIPSFWLIDPDGKIKMTHVEFNQAFLPGDRELDQIISDRILGKDPKPKSEVDKSATDK